MSKHNTYTHAELDYYASLMGASRLASAYKTEECQIWNEAHGLYVESDQHLRERLVREGHLVEVVS